ncbi:MAG: ferritin family protein [Planctomycetes bacterium]|nr:ferritin family protein [Planctomycetota bacterium]
MSEPDCYEDILEHAIAKEVEAFHFYMALADRVEDRQMSIVFEDLAKEELGHKAKLELEIMKTGRTVTAKQRPPRPEGSYIISNDPSPLDMDYKDILMLAMAKEEAAFRTYVNLAARVSDEESREVLLALAEEEVKHKLRFQAEYDTLLKKR